LESWRLSENLNELRTGPIVDARMWRVIWGVWFEMLYFSAGRGYLHAKSLGQGREYLTRIYLLLWYMGIKTLAERIQRTNNPAGARNDGGTTTASPIIILNGNDNTASPVTPNGDENI